MVRVWNAIVCVALLVGAIAAAVPTVVEAETETGSKVQIVTDANFEDMMKDGKPWLLEFYAPWCGYCKQLAPTYERVARELDGEVNVGKVDATVQRGLTARFPTIKGFPTIFYLHGDTAVQFDGSRNADGLKYFATKGWASQEQLSYWNSPFSIIGSFKGLIVRNIYRLQDVQHTLGAMTGLPAPVILVGLFVTGSLVLAVAAFLCTSMLMPSYDEGNPQQQHAHAHNE